MKKEQKKNLYFQARTPILDKGFDHFYPESGQRPSPFSRNEYRYEGVIEFKEAGVW